MPYITGKINKGFTLVELLVVVSIIGMLLGLTLLGLQGSRQSARDAKRKSDIELVRAGLELYKADCKKYPVATDASGDIFTKTDLKGDGNLGLNSCKPTNTYISAIPKDPYAPNRVYVYRSDANGYSYKICASLEGGSGIVSCAEVSSCGSGANCNYQAINP